VRLAFVTGSLAPGGAERQTLALAARLAARGHHCELIPVKDDCALAPPGTVRALGARRYFEPRALARLAARLGALRPDAVVAVNCYALLYAALARRRRARLVVTMHSTKLLGLKEELQMALYRPLVWSADCAVFVCEAQRRHWRRRGVLARRSAVIHNGVDTQAFCPARSAEENARLRAALGLREADFVIGMPALLRPEKNHLQMVEAVAGLRDLGLPARALMIGDGPMRGAVEARARALGVARDVVVTGVQADVRPYVEACDAVALCSTTEAFSLAAIEGMALGKPLVHSEVGGAAEMVLHGVTGYLFPVGDTAALVERLARLADPEHAVRLGHRARGVVELMFSEEAMVGRYERLLHGLCTGRRGIVRPDHGGRAGAAR
jgi:glycosyltransferase involved in cell wall biosynthesis